MATPQFIPINADCIVIGKLHNKAKAETKSLDGKVFPAKPENWQLILVVANCRKNSPLFKDIPYIGLVSVSKATYDSTTEQMRSVCACRVNPKFPDSIKFYGINGIDILDAIEDDDEDD